MTRINVLGVPFDAVTLDGAVGKAMSMMAAGGMVVTPNPEIVWACHTDPDVMEAVASAGLILADGIGVTKAAKKLGRPLPCRVTAADWFNAMLAICAENGKRVFLLGGKPGVAERAKGRIEEMFPGLTVCGAHDGYFNDDARVLHAIGHAKPDFLAVCLGAPKQELWMARNREGLNGILAAGLGGSLDVLAGTVKRAPKFIRKIGFEWLYRALRQPSRVKRLLIIPRFQRAVRNQRKQENKHG